MSKRAEKRALELFPVDMQMCIDSTGEPYEVDVNAQRRKYVAFGYEQAEKETIQRIKELLKVRIVERTERCQEDWSNRQKDRVNIRNDEDGDIILVLEKLGEE